MSAETVKFGVFGLVIGTSVANVPVDPWTLTVDILGRNPFAHATTLRVEVQSAQQLTVTLHDVSGRQLRRLWDAPVRRGTSEILWDGRNEEGEEAPSGIYYCRVDGERARRTVKLIKLR